MKYFYSSKGRSLHNCIFLLQFKSYICTAAHTQQFTLNPLAARLSRKVSVWRRGDNTLRPEVYIILDCIYSMYMWYYGPFFRLMAMRIWCLGHLILWGHSEVFINVNVCHKVYLPRQIWSNVVVLPLLLLTRWLVSHYKLLITNYCLLIL